jgi:hypothetical protein
MRNRRVGAAVWDKTGRWETEAEGRFEGEGAFVEDQVLEAS